MPSPGRLRTTRPLWPKLRSRDPACGVAAAPVATARCAMRTADRQTARIGVSHTTTPECSSCGQGLAAAHQAADRGHELLGALVLLCGGAAQHAVSCVVVEQAE